MKAGDTGRQWGLVGAAVAGSLLVLGLGGLRGLAELFVPHELGADGSAVIWRSSALVAIDGALLLLVSLALLGKERVRAGLAVWFGPGWRATLAALLLVTVGCTTLLLGKEIQDNLTRLGPAIMPYYDRALLFGWPVLAPKEPFSLADFSTSFFLLASAGVAWAGGTLALHRPGPAHPPLVSAVLPLRLWALMFLGLAWAGLDEYAMLHEWLGGNLPGLKDTTLVAHPDDLVIGAYFLAALVVFVTHLRSFARSRLGLVLLLLGGMLQGLALVADASDAAWLREETLEALAAAAYLAALAQYLIEEAFSRPGPAAPAPPAPRAGP